MSGIGAFEVAGGPGRDRRRYLLALFVVLLLVSMPACLVKVVHDGGSAAPAVRSLVAEAGERLDAVQAWAQARRARVSLVLVDRATGERVGLDENEQLLTASVAKLFIASRAAFLAATGERAVAVDDDALLGPMLSASDDVAATVLWGRLGGPVLVGAVAHRFGLTSTAASPDGRWPHTRTTASDLAGFYAHLLGERDSWTDRILGHLEAWTDVGADGYDQRFGLAAVLGRAELAALKQGWMCCVADRWIHLTTGAFGPDGRYVLAVHVAEDVQYTDGTVELPQTSEGIDSDDESAAHARDTVTGVVARLFADGSRTWT
ncbi:hypothetical protein [Gordonia iterans]